MWTTQSLFSDQQVPSGKITHVKGDEIIDDGKNNANILNNFFENVVKNLNIKRYKNHPGIVAISRLVTRKDNFSLNQVTNEKK